MKELIDKITYLIDRKGRSVLTDKMFVNMLRDVYDFRYSPLLLAAINTAYDCNAIKQVLSCSKKKLENEVNKQTRIICKKDDKLETKDVERILYSFAIAAEIISIDDYNKITSVTASPNDNHGNTKSKWCKFDKFLVLNLCAFSLLSTIGLVVFHICMQAEWSAFLCVLAVGIFDVIYASCLWFLKRKHHIDKPTIVQGAFLSATFLVGVFKSFALDFSLIDANNGSLLAILFDGLIMLIWSTGLVDFETNKWRYYYKGWKWWVVFSHSLLIYFVYVFIITLPCPIMGIQYDARNIFLRFFRMFDNKELGFKNYTINHPLPLDFNKIKGVMSGDTTLYGHKMQYFSFKESLIDDSIDMTLLVFEEKIIKINIDGFNNYHDEIRKIYADKYGWAEKPISDWGYIYSRDIDEWTFSQGKITVHSFNYVTYASNIYMQFEKDEKKRVIEAERIRRIQNELELEKEKQEREDLQRQEEQRQEQNYNDTKDQI